MIKKKGRRPKSYYQNLDISNTNIILDSQKQNTIDNSINNWQYLIKNLINIINSEY